MSSFAISTSASSTLRTLGIIGAIAVMACSSDDDVVCPDDLQYRRVPSDTIISAGQQFQAQVTFLGCGGTKVLTDILSWTSSDSTVATVNLSTGLVIGRSTGLAYIAIQGRRYGNIPPIQVHVR